MAAKQRDDIPFETFADMVRVRRLDLQMGQSDLGNRLGGKGQSTIARWESGESVPSEKMAKEIAKILKVKPEEVVALIGKFKDVQKAHPLDYLAGVYELFQWSYAPDEGRYDMIMKSIIAIRNDGAAMRFEENILYSEQNCAIRGSVEVIAPNLYLYGKGADRFEECEFIVVDLPRRPSDWSFGIVAGISSDGLNQPSASRAAMRFAHKGPPNDNSPRADYNRLEHFDDADLPPHVKTFLDEDKPHVISSRRIERPQKLK